MKYLTYLSDGLGIVFVAFSGSLPHDEVASKLGKGRKGTRSAGFIRITPTGASVTGRASRSPSVRTLKTPS